MVEAGGQTVGVLTLAMEPTVPLYESRNDGGFGGTVVDYSDQAINVVANYVLRYDIYSTDNASFTILKWFNK